MKKILPLLALLFWGAASPTLQAQTRDNGRDYAVFFVASAYQNGWTTLSEAPAEVQAIAAELRARYGFSVRIVRAANRDSIEQALSRYKVLRYGPQDQLLLFFSMHGIREGNKKGYLIPENGLQSDPVYKTWFSHDQLADIAATIPCPRVLVAIDACHSGLFGGHRGDKTPKPVWETEEYKCRERLRLAFANDQKTRKYVTAGGDQRVPAASRFAARWLAALRNEGGDDGLLSFRELMTYLDEYIDPRPTEGDFDPATAGDFVLVKKGGCADLEEAERTAVPEKPKPETEVKTAPPTAPGSKPSELTLEERRKDLADFQQAQKTNTTDAYEKYLRDHPKGLFRAKSEAARLQILDERRKEKERQEAAERQKRLEEEDDLDWQIAQTDGSPAALRQYLTDHPEGSHRSEAEALLLDPLELVLVRGGTFKMGCTSEQQDCGNDEKPAHDVTLSDFEIGRYEVTQKLWTDIMGNNPSYFKNCDQCPVEQVSWDDVQEFLKKLNAKFPGRNYRLPTEAEWEYAARGGGKNVMFGNGKNIIDPKEINFNASEGNKTPYSVVGEYRGKTVPVGSLNSPNALGLHDMSGNVWEWCEDDWHGDYKGAPSNGRAWVDSPRGSGRVLRGGSWDAHPQVCRVADRSSDSPDYRFYFIGFRLARTN